MCAVEFVDSRILVVTVIDNLLVVTVYRSPTDCIESFFAIMNNVLHLVCVSKCTLSLNGDFNIKFNMNESNNLLIAAILASYSLRTAITENTRDSNYLDNIITQSNNLLIDSKC